ncbi:uncharacterized protein PSFLO_06404 [Pseudozyma flocculosa]|nr:uncharacterized protein PSFLO_06404 [Pseudozyma flocculosa]
MLLPERQPKEDEASVLEALHRIYTEAQPDESAFAIFANEVILTLPTGDVVVGPHGIRTKFAEIFAAYPTRTLRQRLLVTPESLPLRTIVLDQMLSLYDVDEPEAGQAPVKSIHSLLVLKRKPTDGKVSSLVEEEGHRKATAPLAARAAAASNFYSPTDSQMSPVTSKLNLVKRKHHMKGKPAALFANHSSLRQAMVPGSPAQSQASNADMDF